MEPIQRFTSSVTSNNLWMYVLSLAKDREVQDGEVTRLIFEKFGFLPNAMMIKTVLFRLKGDGYASREKLKGLKAYKATEKGVKELDKAKDTFQNLLQKL